MKQKITLALYLLASILVNAQTVTKLKNIPHSSYAIATDGTYLYASFTFANVFKRYKLTHLNEPPISYNYSTSQNDMKVYNGYLYFASYTGNVIERRPLTELNISEKVIDLRRAVGFEFVGNYLYAVSAEKGIFRYDMTNENPQTTETQIVEATSIEDLKIINDTLFYIKGTSLYKRALNTSIGTDVEEVISSLIQAQDIVHRGNYLYIAQFRNDGDIIRYDIINNTYETFVASSEYNYSLAMLIHNDKLYFSSIKNAMPNEDAFYTVDLTPDSYAYIPDNNFEQALIDLNHDTGSVDGFVPVKNISEVTTLNVKDKNIKSIEGIQYFKNLTELKAINNSIAHINLSENKKLVKLDLYNNKLTAIDLSNNLLLEDVTISKNLLTNIDVRWNKAVKNLILDDNKLTSIIMSRISYDNLFQLELSNNNITSLYLNVAPNLQQLYVSKNKLTTLDASKNPLLDELYMDNMSTLTSVNLKNGGNTNMSDLYAPNTPNLSCIQVDDAAYSKTNWTQVDAASTFSENCVAASINDDILTGFSVYPNPSTTYINVKTENSIKELLVYNMLGKEVLKSNTQKIDITNLTKGVYILKIKTDSNKVGIQQFIKK
ncbi:exported hypothetical protein [Tenacibaculum sp. 190524A02b]|uniref:Secretion system C-terminal sorting domain-containing protein n=1 Tax=Tenacibaculum vairaonense TaxID=3137860 RepID=A0ABP1F798_9FLAO